MENETIEVDMETITAIQLQEENRIRRLQKEYGQEVAYMYILNSLEIKRVM